MYILGKKHIHSRRDNPIIPSIDPVTPVVGSAASHILDHAAEESYAPPLRRARGRVRGSGAAGVLPRDRLGVVTVMVMIVVGRLRLGIPRPARVGGGISLACCCRVTPGCLHVAHRLLSQG